VTAVFLDLYLEITDRSRMTKGFLERSCKPGQYAATAKGLCFIQLYALWEFTLHESVKEALALLGTHGLQLRQIRRELAPLLLQRELQSLKDSGAKSLWEKAIEFSEKLSSGNPAVVSNGTFPSDGSHFRIGQVVTIWSIFGITSPPVPQPRFGTLIGEVVNHRNAIAHGRETPEHVGRRYTKAELTKKCLEMEACCSHVAATLELHCQIRANLEK